MEIYIYISNFCLNIYFLFYIVLYCVVSDRLLEKRREANAAVDLMRETVKRIVDQEEARKGLVILQLVFTFLLLC